MEDIQDLEGKPMEYLINEEGSWDRSTLLAQFGLHLAQVIEPIKINTKLMEDSPMLRHCNIGRTISAMSYKGKF